MVSMYRFIGLLFPIIRSHIVVSIVIGRLSFVSDVCLCVFFFFSSRPTQHGKEVGWLADWLAKGYKYKCYEGEKKGR